MIFCLDQEGTRGETEEICFAMHFLCLQSKSFVDTSIFQFGINIGFVTPKEEFWKSNVYRGIKLILQTWKIWLICVFIFFVFLEYWTRDWLGGHAADTWLSKKMHKIWLAIWFCPCNFRTCLHHLDMPETCLGHY